MARESGRPTKNTVDYFPHHVKEDKTVKILEHKFGAKGYASYYKLLELIGDTEFHRVEFNKSSDRFYALDRTGLDKDEFIAMIDLLIEIGKVDEELWNTEKVIWIDDFVTSLSAVYYKRGRPLPTKGGAISDTRNSQYSIVEESKEEESKAEDMTPTPQFDLETYSKQYPTLDINLSFDKCKLHCEDNNKSLSDLGFDVWVKTDMNKEWNQKKVSDLDMSNKFVTVYCLDCQTEKTAHINKASMIFCETCKEQMIQEYELKHNKGKELERQNNQS